MRKLEDVIAITIVAIVALFICSLAHAEPDYNALVDAIKLTEGVPYYGVKSVHWESYAEARQIAKRTAKHAWRDYKALQGNFATKKGYIEFLANRYCPPSVDYHGNINWKRNMNKLYKGGI